MRPPAREATAFLELVEVPQWQKVHAAEARRRALVAQISLRGMKALRLSAELSLPRFAFPLRANSSRAKSIPAAETVCELAHPLLRQWPYPQRSYSLPRTLESQASR